MLFHSYEFIFGFLPVCLIVFLAVHRWLGRESALVWLGAASIFFYGQWSLAHAALLTGSIVANFTLAKLLIASRDKGRLPFLLLLLAIAANLGLLGYFKYTNFFIENINLVAGSSLPFLEILFPVGISFYTFIQIGFLVEVYNKQVNEIRFSHYLLFGSFFPCVTAGPIILQGEMMKQFAELQRAGLSFRLGSGLTVFGLGLFKKLILADNIAPYADMVFNGVADGSIASLATAWTGALAYTLQLYFDFSGYSDMALGAAYLFGLRLPINFNSPLKAGSITDFWRRWHMTMSRFFTNYVYSPIAIAVMRRALAHDFGPASRFITASAIPITFTFVLAGLWHGAGWTFVVFGLIHGLALAINHGWRQAGLPALPHVAGWLLTMTVVLIGLVFFRAESVPVALTMLGNMIGLGAPAISQVGSAAITIDLETATTWIVGLAIIVLFFPNTQEIMRKYRISSDEEDMQGTPWPKWALWRPSPGWAIACAIVALVAITSISGETTFLYYQF